MMRRVKPVHATVIVVSGLLAVAVFTPPMAAQSAAKFTEAQVFVELNDTDGDLGLHSSIDGEPWTDLTIEGPGDRTVLQILSRGKLRAQGMTQLFFESAEPSFDELAPAEFFLRFPEGRYEIEGRVANGTEMKGMASLSHLLAAPPDNVTLSGQPAADDCGATPLPVVAPPVLIRWDPVTQSHPEIGRRSNVTIAMYQLFVERPGVKLSLDLPPTVTEFEVPTAITALGKDFKFAILARTNTGNNTAIESCFLVP